MGREGRDKRTKRPPQEAGGEGSVGTGLEMAVIWEGYAGKAKGRKQVLWEHGWFLEGMSTAATVAPEMNIDTVLGNLPDFKNERPALQHLVESRGHILLFSPKFHPEQPREAAYALDRQDCVRAHRCDHVSVKVLRDFVVDLPPKFLLGHPPGVLDVNQIID